VSRVAKLLAVLSALVIFGAGFYFDRWVNKPVVIAVVCMHNPPLAL
jgi:hypothetical protein